jgi:hypothetical protein
VRIINHVIAFKKYFYIVKYIIFWKKVKLNDVIEMKCELTGLGRSRDVQTFVYYYENGVVKKSTFLHFRFTGYKSFLYFLNGINGYIKINDTSFSILGIKKLNDKYIKE